MKFDESDSSPGDTMSGIENFLNYKYTIIKIIIIIETDNRSTWKSTIKTSCRKLSRIFQTLKFARKFISNMSDCVRDMKTYIGDLY